MGQSVVESNDTICIVFVCNNSYYTRFQGICNSLRTIGQYTGDITLIIGMDLNISVLKASEFIIIYKVNVIQLSDIQFPEYVNLEKQKIKGNDGRHITKQFQWHKLHIFNSYFTPLHI